MFFSSEENPNDFFIIAYKQNNMTIVIRILYTIGSSYYNDDTDCDCPCRNATRSGSIYFVIRADLVYLSHHLSSSDPKYIYYIGPDKRLEAIITP